MTGEEVINKLQYIRTHYPSKNIENIEADNALFIAIEALKFAAWVADEVIDEELWELNYGAFGEIACRKLEKLGLTKLNGSSWELNK